MAKKVQLLVNALCVVGIVASVGVLVVLNATDWHERKLAEQSISRMESVCEQRSDDEKEAYERQALLYNAQLAGELPTNEVSAVLPYDQQLLFREEPMMSFIEIDKIGVKLPIYHGVGEDVLMAGVGHLEGTSLPVGGPSSHCVLMGHSGMRATQMFDGLEELARGDVLTITTLGKELAYKVVDQRVVLPDQVEQCIAIEKGRDLVTLVTCTPYGVNSHRLLVRAERCALDEGDELEHPLVEAHLNRRSLPLAIAAVILMGSAGFGAVASAKRRVRRRRKACGLHAAKVNESCRPQGGERNDNHDRRKQ